MPQNQTIFFVIFVSINRFPILTDNNISFKLTYYYCKSLLILLSSNISNFSKPFFTTIVVVHMYTHLQVHITMDRKPSVHLHESRAARALVKLNPCRCQLHVGPSWIFPDVWPHSDHTCTPPFDLLHTLCWWDLSCGAGGLLVPMLLDVTLTSHDRWWMALNLESFVSD